MQRNQRIESDGFLLKFITLRISCVCSSLFVTQFKWHPSADTLASPNELQSVWAGEGNASGRRHSQMKHWNRAIFNYVPFADGRPTIEALRRPLRCTQTLLIQMQSFIRRLFTLNQQLRRTLSRYFAEHGRGRATETGQSKCKEDPSRSGESGLRWKDVIFYTFSKFKWIYWTEERMHIISSPNYFDCSATPPRQPSPSSANDYLFVRLALHQTM